MTLLNHETRYYLEVTTLLKEDIDDYNFYCRSNNVPSITIWRSVSYRRFDVVCSWEHLEHKNHEVVCHPLFGPCITAYAEKQLKKMINQHDWRGPTPPTLELSKCRQLVTFRLIQNIECARKLAIDSYLFITCLMEEVRNLQEGEGIL